MQPSISEQERIYSLDVIRGVALLGILLANMPEYAYMPSRFTGANAYVRLFFDLFVQTKFYTIFSFLFGVGFWVFMDRAGKRGEQVNLLFSRRLLVLFLFGVVHLLFFRGDILHLYAAIGFFLLSFYRKHEGNVLGMAIGLLAFSMLPVVVLAMMNLDVGGTSGLPSNEAGFWQNGLDTIWYVFGSEISAAPQLFPEILGLFLLGLYCGKKQVFTQIDRFRRPLRVLQIGSLIATLPSWFLILLAFFKNESYGTNSAFAWVFFSGKTLALFYVTSLMLLLEHPIWQKRFVMFARIGKLAITTYLTQTLVWTALVACLQATGAELTLVTGTILCLILFAVQLWCARLWLTHYRFGPVEWLWRTGTYGKRQQLKRL
ncbi:DUF418 domain-containing protein [Brevibacillus fluminis]|uniref:DUF418 domain-containing protein n=1 Tax=Brevibacillus fluminis TaxID=511487 RepID=A0A3M8DEU1_9BACL|nr:DUF418 domain-containing protein [Brevibacillus fluminis]RNB85845.1 DUF418 domain-containing protein [Brevibacillus fluminis]